MHIVHTSKAPEPIGPYSQAVVHNGLVYLSGQIALDPTSGQLVTDNIEKETHLVMTHIGHLLKEAGSSYGQVVKCSIFLKDLGQFSAVNQVYGTYFSNHSPARECVQVAKLPKDVNVEISVIASVI